MTETDLPISTARAIFADLVERVHWRGERFTILVHGEPRAMLVPITEGKERPKRRGRKAAAAQDRRPAT